MAQSTVDTLDQARFVRDFLRPGRPVVVRAALRSWPVAPPWPLATLVERFGTHQAPLYDTLFSLQRIVRFADYVADHMGADPTGTPPYLRWFARQSGDRLPWADSAFAELATSWRMPDWLPNADYVFPRTAGTVDAATHPFPARGLFVCGRGGRTRLHVDPWVSDACLCQVTGRKRFVMYPPDAGPALSVGGSTVDITQPDDRRYPRWRTVTPVLDEVLEPGDAIFIPAGWYHTATALSDSVSITWNFVHQTHEDRFARYLRAGGATDATVAYFRAARAEGAPRPRRDAGAGR